MTAPALEREQAAEHREVELARQRIGGSVLVFVESFRWGETRWLIMGRVQYGKWPGERRGRTRTLHYGNNKRIAWECWHALVRACLAAREPKRPARRKAARRG